MVALPGPASSIRYLIGHTDVFLVWISFDFDKFDFILFFYTSNRYQKEEALNFRVAKANEVSQLEKVCL